MWTIRLFLLPLLVFFLTAGKSHAQEPVTVTGQINDGGVTRTVTLTLVLSPVQISSYQPTYTTTLSTGNTMQFERGASYGEIIAGAGGLVLALVLIFAVIGGYVFGRNG